MADVRFARVAAVISSDDPYGKWYGEVLRQTGLVCKIGDEKLLEEAGEFDVLILCGQGKLKGDQRKILTKWLSNINNHLIVTGGLWQCEYIFDVISTGNRYSRNKLHAPKLSTNLILAPDCYDCIFIGGDEAKELKGELLATDDKGHPLVATGHQISFFLPHVGQTACLLSLGRGVSSDIIGPGDNSCFTQDGVLRAEDGTNLLWTDRETIPESEDPAFFRPHLDQLREQFLRVILHGIESTSCVPAIVWHLPNNHSAACTVSIECDSPVLDHIKAAAASMAKYTLKPAWMVPPPGLPQDMYRAFKSWGHDIGHLYKPENQSASTTQVKIQNTSIARGVGTELKAFKGWDGAWYGLTRLYELANETGAIASLCKGGRQPGTSGFIFGTARPFCPVTEDCRLNVIEIPSCAFSPGWVTPFSIATHLSKHVARHFGTYHFSFLTSHASEPRMELNLPQLLMTLKEQGFQAVSPVELAKYELGRRRLTFSPSKDHGLEIRSIDPIIGVTVMVGTDAFLRARGNEVTPNHVERYGRTWSVAVFNMEGRIPWHIDVAYSNAA